MDRVREEVVSGGLWIFVGSLSISLSGLLLWILVSRIVGVEVVGVASSIISSATIASAIVSSGLSYAVVRETAARGIRSLVASLIIAFILGLLGGLIVQPLVMGLGYGGLAVYASILVFLTVSSIGVWASLLGFEDFRGYSMLLIIGSAAKLVTGVVAAYLGLGLLSPILGYLAFPLTILVIGFVMLLSRFRGLFIPSGSDFRGVLTLMISNYPYMFSNDLVIMLSIYLTALLLGEAMSTGTLYMAFMVLLSIAAIPGSLLGASLPIGTRRNSDPFGEAFRIGLAIATPLVVLIASMPATMLRIANPDLVGGAPLLEVLLLSLAPLVFLSTSITRFNKENRPGLIGLIGLARLALLVLFIILLVRLFGVFGIALAYLLSTSIVALLSTPLERGASPYLPLFWGIQALPIALYHLGISDQPSVSALLFIASIMFMHLLRLFRFDEYILVARILYRSFLIRR